MRVAVDHRTENNRWNARISHYFDQNLNIAISKFINCHRGKARQHSLEI